MLTVLHTSTSVHGGGVVVPSVVPLSVVVIVVCLNVVLPVAAGVTVVVPLLLLHCFSTVHIVWKQSELETPVGEDEDGVEDDFVLKSGLLGELAVF